MQPVSERARQLYQQGRLAEAETLYRQMLAAAPGDTKAGYLLAVLLYQQEKGAQALGCINEVLTRNSAFPEALMLRGAILHQSDPQQALEDFHKVTALQPGHGEAWYNQGVLLAQLGRNAEAIIAFDRALAITPTPAAWNNRGTALLAAGGGDDALASFARALALNPDFTDALYNRATTLLQLQRQQEALAAFDSFLKRAPEIFAAWHNRGVVLQALGRQDEALESYRRALALRSDYAPAWKNSGLVLKALERYAEAAEAFGHATALSPADAEVWSGQGQALANLKRYDDAIGCCEKALALTPDDAQLWFQYATILRAIQRFDAALAAQEKSLTLAPDDPPALAAKAALLCEMNRIAEGLADYQRCAALSHDKAQPATGEPPHRMRHDVEQRAWLQSEGVTLAPGDYRLMGGARLASGALNPANREADAQWQASDLQIVVIDDLLTDEALAALRRFCWGSTVWQKAYPNGYLGALPEHGFACPLLAQIVDELRDAHPAIFGSHGLIRMWGFKYDSSLRGIRLHADQAAVNVNFWITPDSANRNPRNGGLVVWDKTPPPDWDFRRYNSDDEKPAREFLAQAGAMPVVIPYRANRAVIFDSDLFHETDTIEFEEGYLNRRINVTMLFGRRTFDAS